MKKVNKTNLFMYVLVVLAIVMMSSTITMAFLTDRKQGKEDIEFGKVAISGVNSLLELDIEDTITTGSEILNEDRYFYFSPTTDTQNMYVRFKIAYKIDDNGTDYTEVLSILNEMTGFKHYGADDDTTTYTYTKVGNYYYLSDRANATPLEVKSTDSAYIISNDYAFSLSKEQERKVYSALTGVNVKLVVTIEAIQSEGITFDLSTSIEEQCDSLKTYFTANSQEGEEPEEPEQVLNDDINSELHPNMF